MRPTTFPYGLTVGLLIAVTSFGAPASAQSEFLEEGTNGFFLSAGGGTGSDINDIGGSIGFTLSGRFDLGLGLARSTFDGSDLSAVEFAPFASVAVLKQNKQVPISIYFSGGYHNASYSADMLDEFGWDMSATGFSIGGSVYGSIAASQTTRIVPDFGISYFSGDTKIEDSFGGEVSADASGTIFSFGSSIGVSMPSGNIFSLRAGLNVNDDGDARFAGQLGMTFAFRPAD